MRWTVLLLAGPLLVGSAAGCLGDDDALESTGPDEQAGADGDDSAGQASSGVAGADRTLAGNLSLGYVVGAGPEALVGPDAAPAEDQGTTAEEHWPTASIHVPEKASKLAVSIQEETVDTDEPGIGAYSVEIQTHDGESAYLDWISAKVLDPEQFDYQEADPTPGEWTIELDPNGAVINQAWTVEIVIDGASAAAPTGLDAEDTC